jgi:ribosomal protein S18 acetylase RimI-like enzyme
MCQPSVHQPQTPVNPLPVIREEPLKIIEISKDEIGSIKTLWESLNAYHLVKSTHFKSHFSKFTFEMRMEDLNKRDHLVVYVAEDNNERIGYCIASVDGLVGEIDSLFVKNEYRKQGVGEEVMTRALKWLEEQNCKTIRVSIAEGNESALNFYRKFGFAERLIVMQRVHNQET